MDERWRPNSSLQHLCPSELYPPFDQAVFDQMCRAFGEERYLATINQRYILAGALLGTPFPVGMFGEGTGHLLWSETQIDLSAVPSTKDQHGQIRIRLGNC